MKAADARKFIPSELRLVELFGHVPTIHFWDSGALTTLFLRLRLRGKTHCSQRCLYGAGTLWGASFSLATLTALSASLMR